MQWQHRVARLCETNRETETAFYRSQMPKKTITKRKNTVKTRPDILAIQISKQREVDRDNFKKWPLSSCLAFSFCLFLRLNWIVGDGIHQDKISTLKFEKHYQIGICPESGCFLFMFLCFFFVLPYSKEHGGGGAAVEAYSGFSQYSFALITSHWRWFN